MSFLAIGALASAASAPAKPVGLIRQFKLREVPVDLLSGPGGIWFTYFRDTSNGEVAGIGRITTQGRVTKFSAGLNPRSQPAGLTVGPDGNVWFSDVGKRPAIGRITPRGKITEFSSGISLTSRVGPPVAGPEGNVWFGVSGKRSAIGRITPQGSLTEFSAGLDPRSAPGGLVLGSDGNLWFSDEIRIGASSSTPAIGRITPSGEIAEFSGVGPIVPSTFDQPVLGADGNLWFSASTTRIGRVTPSGDVTEFSAALSPEISEVGPFVAGADGNVWFAARGNAYVKTAVPGPASAIGRITPSGAIAEFSECLHAGPPYTGPNDLALGPEGDVWYTSTTTRSLPNIGTPPAIGRVSPSGVITEFRQGLFAEGEPDVIVAGAEGNMWFADRAARTIGRIAPSAAPANTFILGASKPAAAGPGTRLSVTVPGPGDLALEPLAVESRRGRLSALPHSDPIRANAPTCGATFLEVTPRVLAHSRFARVGEVGLRVRITFTPTGGSPYSRIATIRLELHRRR